MPWGMLYPVVGRFGDHWMSVDPSLIFVVVEGKESMGVGTKMYEPSE